MQPTQAERVRVYEPRPDRAANADPLGAALFAKTRRRVLSQLALCPFVIALGVWNFAIDNRSVAIPSFLVFIFGLSFFFWARAYLVTIRPMGKLLGGPFRELWPGQGGIQVAGSKVSLRLPGDGEPQWIVVRLAAAKRLQLAGQRRAWVLGPGPGGHAVVLLPGSIVGAMGRLRSAPAAGSTELPVEPRQPCGPNEDRVLLARLATVRKGPLTVLAVFVVLVGWLLWISATLPAYSGPSGDFYSVFVPAMVGVAAILSCLVIVAGRKVARNPTETTWTELVVLTGGAIDVKPSGVSSLQGWATMPDGSQVALALNRVDLNLLVNIAATGRVWILGSPRTGVRLRAGLPGYPVFGSLKLTA